MATDIKLTDLTNGSTVNGKWEGTGVFDVLLKTINENINIQYDLNRIKDTDYATVYLGSLQSAMQQSIEYLFKEQLTEAQIDGVLKDNLLKDAQLKEQRNKEEAELEKQWGYDITRDVDDNLIMGNSTGNGIIDKQGIELDKNVDVKERSAVVQETEAADKLLTTAKQRTLLDEEKETSDKQQLLLDIQNEVETYKKNTLLVDEHNANLKKIDSVTKDIDVKERGTVVQEAELADKLLTTAEQRKLLEAQEKEAYVNRIIKDKEAVKAGLDNIQETVSKDREDIYTPKYETI